MLSGVKFIPRDKVLDENSKGQRKKSVSGKDGAKKKTYDYSSSDDGMEKITKGSRRKKKWYSSDESSESDSKRSESESEESLDYNERKRGSKKKSKSRGKDSSDDDRTWKRSRSEKEERKKIAKRSGKDIAEENLSDDSLSPAGGEIIRREMGLDWMLRPSQKTDTKPTLTVENKNEETPIEDVKKADPKELNPYLKDNGTGYPEERDEKKAGGDQLLSSSLVGDGGASWRLKALKRAKEQASREGRRFEEVVQERWGSLGKLAVSAASHTAAPSRAHLHAIKNRRKGLNEEEQQIDTENPRERHSEKGSGGDYLRDVSLRHPKMKAPKTDAALYWGKRKNQPRTNEDASLISEAASSLNKFANDGNFMQEMLSTQKNGPAAFVGSNLNAKSYVEHKAVSSDKTDEQTVVIKEASSANQLAAKALQLRMKGKHEEAQKLLEEADRIKARQAAGDDSSSSQHDVRTTTRYAIQDVSARRRGEDDNTDRHLARTIIQNKQFSVSGQADDEYDYGDAPNRKSRKKVSSSDGQKNISERDNRVKHILTQQERCSFCFENPNHPKHLVVSIANFTYLMLPQYEPVVPGHCCILPMQHEAASRNVDDNVWEEMRNFKKCLIMMFAKQEKDVVFLETVMGLSQQRRHCLIECIPLPSEIAKEAPLYFKKAIDEAEDEWSQHNAKKLIDTSVKGLRNSIPKNFPYFHVEFGLSKGFVHVIDDEKQFKSSIGLNVIRGMLELPEEDMYRRRRRHITVDSLKQAVTSFVKEWEPFDWTKQLD